MNKSSVGHTRFFDPARLAVLITAFVFSQHTFSSNDYMAEISKISAEAEEKREAYREQANTLIKETLASEQTRDARAEAQELVGSLSQSNETMREAARERNKQQMAGFNTIIFASKSLGHAGLKEIMQVASGREDTVIVFRGIEKGANLGEAMWEIQEIAAAHDPMPNILINPELFSKYKIDSVPAVVLLEETINAADDDASFIGRVVGIYNPDWLKREIKNSQTADLGKRGDTADILEPDLTEEIKRRMMGIDWEDKKQQAIQRFWAKQNFHTLPRATKSSVRLIDPTIEVTKDITDAEGSVIIAKGTKINPLDMRPFNTVMVIFDPLDRKQIDLVQTELASIRASEPGKKIVLMATQFDSIKGWDSYKEVTDTFNTEVFLLKPEIISRFELNAVPSVVTARGKNFEIKEMGAGAVQ